MLDIDFLHKQPKIGRKSGKTTAMLVELLQNVEFSNPGQCHVLFIPEHRAKFYLYKMIYDLSVQLGLRISKVVKTRNEIQFENKGYIKFVLNSEQGRESLRGLQYREFFETYY